MRAALGIGSNLGDRVAHLRSVVQRIRAHPEVSVVAVSPVVETDPVGGPDQPDYLNAVVVIETTLSAPELLDLAHDCEDAADRTREVRWGPRTLDVDLLAFGEQVSGDAVLTVPHPRATERAFVLIPWTAVDPEFVVNGRRVEEWAAEADASGVRSTEVSL